MVDAALEGKRSWRSPPRGGLVRRSRYVWRWILSFLAIGLVALALYWAWPRPDARTLLLVLGDDREERNILPPVPYVAADTTALQTWAQAARVPSLALSLSKVETPAWLARQLSSATANSQLKFRVSPNGGVIAPKKDDTLVIYIKGHGLALDMSASDQASTGDPSRNKIDARPILIKSLSENDLSSPWYRDDSYVLDVRQLLQELAALPDLRKLVIFDTVHLNYDPRLGMLVNAFPTAVKQAVEQLPSRTNLWVLIGQGDGELAVSVPEAARSALVDSLVGSLEQKRGDGNALSLSSLQERVETRLAALNQAGPGSFIQKLQESFPPAGKGLANGLMLPMSPLPRATDKAATTAPTSADVAKAAASSAPAQAITAPVQQAVTDAKAAASVSGSSAPPAPAKDATTPPAPTATTPASTPNGQTAGAPPAATPSVPGASPSTAPAPAPPGPPPTDLQLAWESRDRLRAAFKNGWSPAHIGPQLWRRIEGVLAGFDEQRLIGEQNQKDSAALAALRDDLIQLESIFSGRPGSCSTESCNDLAKSLAAFRLSPAFRSFQARQQSGLETANDALKIFAETAYRARDYVYLHGQTLSVLDGGPFANDAALSILLDKLQALRTQLDPTGLTDSRLTETRSRELSRLTREADQARDQVEREIEDYAQSVAKAPTSPGKLLRVRLLLHSPAVIGNLRTELRKQVPAKAGEAPASASSPPLGERLATNVRLMRKLAAIIASPPASPTTNTKPSATAFAAWTRALDAASPKAEPLAWFDLGRASRDFADSLTKAIKVESSSRGGARQDSTPLDSWELFKTVLLLDGRDTGRLNDGEGFASWLAQPIRPELVPDKIELAVPSSPVQLHNPDQEATLVTLGFRIQSEKQAPYSITLDLRWNANDIDVASGDGSALLRQGKNELTLETEQSELQLRIKSRRMTSDTPATSIRAQASFGSPQLVTADLRCLLPRPDQIELTIAADDNLQQAKRRTWAPSTPEGGRLNLFANRERTLGLYLTNLSSEDKKLIARLYRVPAAATSPGGRLFDPKAGLSLLPNAATLDTRLKQPNTDIATLLRGQLIAQTTDKEPYFALPAGSAPVKVPLVAVPPGPPTPGGAATPTPSAERTDDATGGLLLVVLNADGKSKPYFKWIELQMLQPDDLLAIKEPLYRDGRLSYRVELKDPKLIEEMGIGKDSLKLNWETRPLPPEVREPTKDAELTASSTQGTSFTAIVPPTARWPLLLQLGVDRNPRALVTSLEKRGESPLATNLKENHLPSVHIWRAGASPSRPGMPPERQQVLYRPKFPWLAYPAAVVVAEGIPEGQAGQPIFVRIDPKAPTTRLDLSLGADVAPRYFTDGARLRVSTEGLSQEFATERQVSFRATIIEGGLLQVQCEAGDFSKIEFGPIDVPQDKRLTFTAEVEGNFRTSGIPEDSHDSVTFVLDRTPPRILELTAEKIPASGIPIPGVPNPTKIQIRCRADDGDGSGIAKLEFIPGFDQNNNRKLDPMEQQPPLPAIKQPDGYYEAQFTFPGELPNRVLFLVEAIATDNVQYASVPAQASLELTKPQEGGQRTTFGGKKIDDPLEKLLDKKGANKK